MVALVFCICPGLMFYWSSRIALLSSGIPIEIDAALEHDLLVGRKILTALRAAFLPFGEIAG